MEYTTHSFGLKVKETEGDLYVTDASGKFVCRLHDKSLSDFTIDGEINDDELEDEIGMEAGITDFMND